VVDPEEAFRKAGEPGAKAAQLALALLGAGLLMSVLVWIPAVVKGEQTLLNAVGLPGAGSDGSMEREFEAMFGRQRSRSGPPSAPGAMGVFLKRVAPLNLVLFAALSGIGYLSTMACVAMMGKVPRVAHRSFVILGLSLLPAVAACAVVFLLGWVHAFFYVLLGCGTLLSLLFYYQGLRTMGNLRSGKAAYSACAVTVVLVIAAPIVLAMFVSSW
jgi:hypothetical protein